eukprot:4657110-Alexandrium_andersonii.AAC.1
MPLASTLWGRAGEILLRRPDGWALVWPHRLPAAKAGRAKEAGCQKLQQRAERASCAHERQRRKHRQLPNGIAAQLHSRTA